MSEKIDRVENMQLVVLSESLSPEIASIANELLSLRLQPSLKLESRKMSYGCGIYEAGDREKCYVKLFVTDSQRVMPITGHIISDDDLMEVYKWGRLDERGGEDDPNA
jgi:hypothetical protein